jgi:hypothetical protein
MLRLAIVFLVIALIAAFLGFGEVASFSWGGRRSSFSSSLSSRCCLSWDTGTGGGRSGDDGQPWRCLDRPTQTKVGVP